MHKNVNTVNIYKEFLNYKLKLLIAGSKFKAFHLKEFGDALKKFGFEYKLVTDIENYDPYATLFRGLLTARRKLNKLIDDFRPDAVFIDSPSYFGLAVTKKKIPVYMLLRGDYWSEIKWARETLYKSLKDRILHWWYTRIGEKSIKNSTAIVPICKYLEKVTRLRYPQKYIEVLYGGIDSSKWFLDKGMNLNHPCVGLLQSSTIWGKTREMFTLTKVLESMPDVTFYWVGDGLYKDKVLPTLQKYKNFKWLGYLKYPEEVRKYFSEIDVYALISGIDMAPLTLLEAELMELPVIATDVGGIPELMEDGKTGYLVKKGDADDLIKKLSILLDDDAKAKQMGKEARRFVEKNFTWELIAKRFSEILKNTTKVPN